MADLQVIENADERRFEAWLDGVRAGVVEYRRNEGTYVLVHTAVEDEHEGEGVGSSLAQAVLDNLRERGLTARVECPFIRGWIERHPDYADVLAD